MGRTKSQFCGDRTRGEHRVGQGISEPALDYALEHLTETGLANLLECARREAPEVLKRISISLIDSRSHHDHSDRPPAEGLEARETNAFPTKSLRILEEEHITRVVSESKTLVEAATRLGIHTTTLWRKLKRYKTPGL